MASPTALHDLVEFFAELEALAGRYKTLLGFREKALMDGESSTSSEKDMKKRKRVKSRDPNAPKYV